MDKEKKEQHNYAIILLLMLLAAISLLAIYAATDTWNYVILQTFWYFISIIVIFILMKFDAEVLWKIAPLTYLLGILCLIAVLFFGVTIGGAKRWLNFGIMNFQTSEVMKIAFILMLSRCVTQHNFKNIKRTIQSDLLLLLKIVAISIPPVVLVMLQPDLGTTIVFLAIISGITLLSGISWKILLPLFSTFVGIITTLFYFVLFNRPILYRFGFHSYQFDRVDVWLEPYKDISDDSYQTIQSMKAIGSGQITGKGLGISEVHVPENHTDFIFTAIGENFGFVGGGILLLIYFLLIYRLVVTCFLTKSEFYTYIVTGVLMLICFHIFENIGMTIGILPVTGIPLPFISYGGSSLLGNMAAVGLVLSMNKHNREYVFSTNHKKWHFLT